MSNRSIVRERPLGITIIAILLFISAIWGIITGLASIGFAPLALLHLNVVGVFRGALDGVFIIIIALVELWLASGLWRLRPWAFWATVIIEVINVLYYLFGIAGQISIGFGLGTGIIAIIILLYMFADSNVRRAFGV